MKVLRGFRNQCPTCNDYFNSNFAFEKHRVGKAGSLNRRCRTREEMLQIGMSLNKDGFWITKTKDSSTIGRIKDDEAKS
jgi:hypothetical protein